MTPIQHTAILPILEGKDILGQAQTGSGKTLAFVLPLVHKIKAQQQHPQALIITPTRELGEQVAGEIQKVARYKAGVKVVTLYGGKSLTQQVASLEKGADILVGTPGRLLDHLSRQTIELSNIETLILDEADRMLDMGFSEAILKIVSNLPRKRQNLLFSATYPENINTLASTILTNPLHIKSESVKREVTIEERAFSVEHKEKALMTVLQSFKPSLVLIFCNTKVKTNEVANVLQEKGFDVAVLHGDLEQYEREEMLVQFANGSLPVMVATDLAARGLDVEGIDLVINYEVPMKSQEYTHRIGRTGRAEAKGLAITLCDTYGTRKLNEIHPSLNTETLKSLRPNKHFFLQGERGTLCIDGGKKKKLRAGDILGTLCKDVGIEPHYIGKIDVYERNTFVAIDKSVIKKAFHGLKQGKIKKRKFRIWWL
jgi:ATP-independent RNA helicase DbpA